MAGPTVNHRLLHHNNSSSLDFFLFFFFQAEDGIRDPLVTGVQTCALPISYSGTVSSGGSYIVPPIVLIVATKVTDVWVSMSQEEIAEAEIKDQEKQRIRSEERRVGKECRSRWAADH